jgi:hypothetical protein
LEDLPNPTYLMPPEKVSLIISGKEAKATWLPPISLPFQGTCKMSSQLNKFALHQRTTVINNPFSSSFWNFMEKPKI